MNPGRAELQKFAPHWCLYWANSFARSQFEIWLPLLERSRYRYVVLVDGPGATIPTSLRPVEEGGKVLFCESSSVDKSWLRQLSSFRGFLYISNKNRIFGNVGSFPNFRHVFIGHGESAKASSGSRVASLYDSVFLANYASSRRFPAAVHHVVRRRALAIGAPIVDGVVPLESGHSPAGSPPVILYAPTWEGHSPSKDYSSLPEISGALAGLLADGGHQVILRPHPGNGKRSEAHRTAAAELWAAGAAKSKKKAADINRCHVLIGDLSGATSEFLFSRKPVVIPYTKALETIGVGKAHIRTEYPWAYVWDTTTQELGPVLEEALGPDPLRGRREAAADAVFRGHRSSEEAARTFDLALGAVAGFRNPLLRRFRFELARARRLGRGVSRPARSRTRPAPSVEAKPAKVA
jgi:hypothetical protein